MAIEQRGDPETGATYFIDTDTGAVMPSNWVPSEPGPAYSGAGDWSKYFSQANDFGRTGFYGVPGSVGKMLSDAAQRAGVSGYDFNQAAAKAAPGYGWQLPGANGWLLGANEEQIYRNILQNADDPRLQELANERSQESYNTGARAGAQRDAELAARNAADDGGMGDLTKLALLAATVYGGGSLAGLWGSGAGMGAGSLAGEISGSLGWGGADALSSLGGQGLMDFLSADAASAATAGSTTGAGNMGFFDELLGIDPGTSWADEISNFGGADAGSGYTIDMAGHAIDAAGNVVNGTDGSIWDYVNGAMKSGSYADLARVMPSLPPGTQTAIKALLGGSSGSSGGSSSGGKSLGGSILDRILGGGNSGGSLLGGVGETAFNSLPFLLALKEANSQTKDAQPYIDKLTGLGDQFSGNQSAFIKSLTDPYDQSTATGRGQLQQSLGLRGVSGSSFGDQSLNNYDYTRDMGRGDLVAKATTSGIGAEGGLLTSALDAVNKRNLNKNALLGAGLSASGRLFQPANDPFNIKSLLGA